MLWCTMVQWVEILNVIFNDYELGIVIKWKGLTGIKWFRFEGKGFNQKDKDVVLEFYNKLLEYAEDYKYVDSVKYELLYASATVVLEGKQVGCWVGNSFYFDKYELCN